MRQLNFYGFRKIKYNDTIRIDTALEAQTANFWRFRHENFRKGRPDLLIEIKRSNSNPEKKTNSSTSKSGKANEDVAELKTELETLKDTIAKMSCNIDTLTSLVEHVKIDPQSQPMNANQSKTVIVKQENESVGDSIGDGIYDTTQVGSKRKKLDTGNDTTSTCISTSTSGSLGNSSTTDSRSTGPMDMEMAVEPMDVQFTPAAIFPPEPVLSQGSYTQPGSDQAFETDQAFVDELLNVWDEGDNLIPDLVSSGPADPLPLTPEPMVEHEQQHHQQQQLPPIEETPRNPNAPDKALMNNLSEALTVLPKEMQEMLVNRLITTVTSSELLKNHLDSVCGLSNDGSMCTSPSTVVEKKQTPTSVSPSPPTTIPVESKNLFTATNNTTNNNNNSEQNGNPDIALPLAAATLTALMTQWTAAMKDKTPVANKSIPAIAIHA